MNNNKMIELSEANFEQVVRHGRRPVLVEFWADWSEPCRAMSPVIEAVASDELIPVEVARVNVPQHGELAERFGVQALPTLLIFNHGSLQDQLVGRTTEEELRNKLEAFI